MMGKAIFRISAELMKDVLSMPALTKILEVSTVGMYKDSGYDIEFFVAHPDIPDGAVHEVTPIVRKIEWDWNIQDSDG